MVHTNLTISIITLNVHVLTFAGGNMIPLSYHRKDIWGIHTKEGDIVARFIGAKRKDSPQVPYVSSMRWLSSVLLWKKTSLWGCKPAPVPLRPRRART